MKERIISGIVLFLFLAAVVLFNQSFPLALNIAVAIISGFSVYEIIKALGMQKKWLITLSSVTTAAIIPFSFDQQIVFIVYCAYTLIIFSSLIKMHEEITFKEISIVFSLVVIIPVALRTLISLRLLGDAHGMFYVLIAIFAAWVADAGAYFVGTFIGKHKLCPEISPKKTIEGAVGGVLVNVLVMALFGWIFTQLFYNGERHANYLMLVMIGLFGGIISILGDLSFSLIKRSCHIKDFGHVIPGHGGILDRFDSVIFTAPFVFILVSYFPLVAG